MICPCRPACAPPAPYPALLPLLRPSIGTPTVPTVPCLISLFLHCIVLDASIIIIERDNLALECSPTEFKFIYLRFKNNYLITMKILSYLPVAPRHLLLFIERGSWSTLLACCLVSCELEQMESVGIMSYNRDQICRHCHWYRRIIHAKI